jgi:high affinity sulfate transporter 1
VFVLTDQKHQQTSIRGFLRQVAPGLEALSQYEISWLRGDIAAGLSVAAVALPVGIAYSYLASVPPVIGIYAAIFPLFAYALFGSSRQLITGPDAATCIMAAAILGPLAGGDPERYQALMVVLTLCTGLIYVVAGISRLGFIANFLSLPILAGFLNGIALIIVAGQLSKLFGYSSEASDFFPKLVEFVEKIETIHTPTLILGVALLIGMVALRRLMPRLPHALVILLIGIALVVALELEKYGVSLLGSVPAGLPPAFHMPKLALAQTETLLINAAGLVLVSFTSGILTAKSFAQRNRYQINPHQELIGFGACNIASGLAQGFPVTGAASRTAVNDAMGGKSQLVGIVAGGAMLLILFFLTEPLANVPHAALAAIIIVSAAGLFDFSTLRELYALSHTEQLLSVGTTLGVLILGVLPGVMLAVVLSLLKLLAISSRPPDAVLGRVPGMEGFHNCKEYPEATTIPGLLLYRFDANVVFFNADYFGERILKAIAAADTPVEWVVIDASPINVFDVTALKKFDDLIEELKARGIVLALACEKRTLDKFFELKWVKARRQMTKEYRFHTLESAVDAFYHRGDRKKYGAESHIY